MRLKAGRSKYALPKRCSGVFDMFVHIRECSYVIMQITPANMRDIKRRASEGRISMESFVAVPNYFCVIGNELELWPAPDKAYLATVEIETREIL